MKSLLKWVAVVLVVQLLVLATWFDIPAYADGTTINQNISQDTVFTKAGSPYYINARVTIDKDATLTIEPGVELISERTTANGFLIYGSLKALGTLEEPIKMHGLYITATSYLQKNGILQLDYTNVTNTDFTVNDLQLQVHHSDFSKTSFILSGTFATIESSYFHDSSPISAYPDVWRPGNLVIKGNTFSNQGYDFQDITLHPRETDKIPVTITENNFFRTAPNLYMDSGIAPEYMNATNNYWGTTILEKVYGKIIDGRDNSNFGTPINAEPYAYKPFANGYPMGELEAPTVAVVTDQSATITGTTDADSVVQVWKNNSLVAGGHSNNIGQFEIAVPETQAAGTELRVTATDSYYRTSATTSLMVKDVTAPQTPQLEDLTDQSVAVSGTTEANAAITVKINGITVGTGTADATTGQFQISIPKQTAGTIVEVTATDAARNVSPKATATVRDVTPPAKPVVTTEVTDQSNVMSGTSEAYATVELYVNNQLRASYNTSWGTSFSFALYPVLKAGSDVKVIAVDQAGNRSEPTVVTVKDVTAPYLYYDWLFPPNTDTPVIKGIAEAGAKLQILKAGVELVSGTAPSDGHFSLTFPAQSLGTWLVLRATDAVGNSVEKKVQVVLPPNAIRGWYRSAEGKLYYYNEKSERVTGWYPVKGEWYLFNEDGTLRRALFTSDGKLTYFHREQAQ